MKIDFTSKQYRELVQLLNFNMEIFKEVDSTEYKEYLSLIQHILSYEELSKALDINSEDDEINDIEGLEKILLLKEAYDDAIFWKGLCRRMVAEKLFEEDEDFNFDNIEEYAEKRMKMEESLLNSFKSGEFSIRETER